MVTTVLLAVSLAGAGQVVPPPPPPPPQPVIVDPGQMVRDPARRPPEPKGTGIIRGRVVAADTGTAIRRGTVSLLPMPQPPPTTTTGTATPASGTPVQIAMINGVMTPIGTSQGGIVRPKSATTDAQGAFEFRELPAGRYRLTASPAQYSAGYLSMAYGAKKPSGPGSTDPGTPIDLADGQVFDKAAIALARGGVITGRVTDENGEALARVQVYSLFYPGSGSRGLRTGSGAQTDDLGQFRLFGLAPGEYAVAAEARGNTFVNPNAPPETEEDKTGFLTTFYPGTPDDATAQRVRTRTGAETPGIEIRMVSGRLFRLAGMVVDSQGRTSVRTNGTLYKRTTQGAPVTSTFGFSTDEQGRFQMRNIPPGNYRLTVRQQMPPNAARNPDGSFSEQGEFASMALSIDADLDNVLVTTSPGATITGTVVFESGPPQLPAGQTTFQMRVSSTSADAEYMMGQPNPFAQVSPDMTFTLKGLSGEMLLRGSGAPGNVLKSVQVGAEEVIDTPHEFKSGERVTLVFTSRASTLEGNVTDGVGKPTEDATLLLFSDDKSLWRNNSIRTRRNFVDQAGHFKFSGLLAGRYYLIAVPRDRILTLTDASGFEALSKEATTVVIGEDEQRQVDVKVSAGGGL